ncbi:MAG TPA: class I SAM-dependent methyltransferase [Rubellimicrobium sp.]|nr:class I SAM-dependent methyltransferase [Rubellimicrobium sp.]
MPQASRTESEIVAAQYRAWVYPAPVPDMAEAIAGGYWDLCDPSLFRRKLWPRRAEPDHLEILVAGCGTNQAACYAFNNRDCRVVGLDLSDVSLGHQAYLKQKHGLENLELVHMSLGDVASLGRTFDLIVSTGVLHHLPDPDAGLRRLRDVLRPHGVVSAMVYGRYPRLGVYMMQEVFRVLGLRQDAQGIELVKRAVVHDAPAWHHLRAYTRVAPDLGYDSGLVDTFLHPLDRAYTVPEVLRFARDNGLKLQSWLDKLDYSITASIMDPENPLRQRVGALPEEAQWQVVELVAQSLATHRFLLCHPGRPESDYEPDFGGEAWLDYVPSLRPPGRISRPADATEAGRAGTSPPWSDLVRRLADLPRRWRGGEGAGAGPEAERGAAPEPPTLRRGWHAAPLTAFEAGLLEGVDGRRTIRELVGAAAPEGKGDGRPVAAARELFRCMADWDHVLFRIP